jgi:hypothetical protein
MAEFIEGYLSSNPTTDIAIVGHSQGGVLPTYTIKEALSESYQSRVLSVVTMDSPLGGINRAGAQLYRSISGCAHNDFRLDSPFDLLTGSGVISRINDSIVPSAKLYTVDGNPGCGQVLQRFCTRFPLIDDSHSTTAWATDHIRVAAQTHGDIWDGCFGVGRECVASDGSGLNSEGTRLVDFVACAVVAASENCGD